MRRRLRAVRSARLRHRAVPDRRDQNKKKRASKDRGARKCFCLGLIRCGNDADKTYATAYTCDFQIDVSAQLGGANGQDQTYVPNVPAPLASKRCLMITKHGASALAQRDRVPRIYAVVESGLLNLPALFVLTT